MSITANEESAAVLRHTVQFAVSRGQSAQEVMPLLGWVADKRRDPVALALESCRRDLAASPTSATLAREVAMLEHAADLPTWS